MATCIVIAVISAAASMFGSWNDKKQIAKSLSIVLKSKEGYEINHPSEQLKGYIDQLKAFVAEMGESP